MTATPTMKHSYAHALLANGLVSGIGFGGSLLVHSTQVRAEAPEKSAAAQDFQRCAACHTATGAGVPGAFPPLKANVIALAQSAPGRRYLVGAVYRGLAGQIQVDGKRYMGVMPAQSQLTDSKAAAVLNHVVANIAGGKAKAFTAADVSRLRQATRGSSSAQIAVS